MQVRRFVTIDPTMQAIFLLERPFPALEKVLDTVIETGKFTQLSKGSCLIVKENYLEEKLKAHVSRKHIFARFHR